MTTSHRTCGLHHSNEHSEGFLFVFWFLVFCFFAVRWNTEISSGHVFYFRDISFSRHTTWDAQELQRGSGLALPQDCSSCSQTYHTDLRPLAIGLPGHCSSPTIPHTPFWGETLYFRLVRGQSPAFVPNKSRQQQEQTERSDLPTKHEKVFHYHCCIIITQASRHLLMWQLIFIINVFWQVFKRPLTGTSLTYRGLGKEGLAHSPASDWNVGGQMKQLFLLRSLTGKKQKYSHRCPVKIQSVLKRLIRLN